MKVTGLSTGLPVEGQRVARGIWFSVFGFRFGGQFAAARGALRWLGFVGSLRGGGGALQGVLPPHPRPLSPFGGEGGSSVFSFQSGGQFAASRRALRCWVLWGACVAVVARCRCVAPSPPTPLPLRGRGEDLVAGWQFSVASWDTPFPSRLRGFA